MAEQVIPCANLQVNPEHIEAFVQTVIGATVRLRADIERDTLFAERLRSAEDRASRAETRAALAEFRAQLGGLLQIAPDDEQ